MIQWAVMQREGDSDRHVVPYEHGAVVRPHMLSEHCVCGPKRDEEDQSIVIHHDIAGSLH